MTDSEIQAVHVLLDASKTMAFSLLRDFGEFYPIAYIVPAGDRDATNLMLFDDNEFPQADAVKGKYLKILVDGVANGQYTAGCVCTDILIQPDSQDALEYEFIFPDVRFRLAQPYLMKNGVIDPSPVIELDV
jgi:hypothetical protein